RLLDEAAAQDVFPSARAVVLREGKVAFEGGVNAPADAIWDLASLTKVVCTTPLFVSLWAEGLVAPETPLGRDGLTLADLLYHRSGLPAFVPYFAAALKQFPRLLDPQCPAMLRETARESLLKYVWDTKVIQKCC